MSFFNGQASFEPRSTAHAVRLVRGSSLSGSRYTYSTVAYGGDGANNAVNDAWTGLQWRRCEQGRVWDGIACTGAATPFTHEQALAHARDQTSWRLPNVKELGSLVDLSVSGGARIDPEAFPGAGSNSLWTSSPYVGDIYLAWYVFFNNGYVANYFRTNTVGLRLVRVDQ